MISIVMPVRNAQPFLKECIQSIQQQSYANWELIAINDHSSDDSLKILQQFAKTDSRINVFQNTGKGILPALQLAFSHAKGIYVTRMDADDIMPTLKLELMRAALQGATQETLVTGKVKYISAKPLGQGYINYMNWVNGMVMNSNHFEHIYKECVIPSAAWMCTRQTLDKCGGFNGKEYPEDYDLCFRFYQNKINVIGLREVLHIWRDHPNRASRTDANYADYTFLNLKLNYFLKLNHQRESQLVVYGAGEKGKRTAKFLQETGVSFIWACNNPRKIGQNLFGIPVVGTEIFQTSLVSQLIVLVSNPMQQKEIRSQIKSNSKITPFWFC